MAAKPECVLEAKCWLGEGPSWSAREQALYWTDLPARRIHRFHPASGDHRKWHTAEMITAIGQRARGGLIVATATQIGFFDPGSGRFTPFVRPEADKPGNRSNDGKCDSRGRFWYGTMQNNVAPDGGEIPVTEKSGSLWRIDPDGGAHRADSGIAISNTFAWSPDDRIMYFADTFDAIYAYDFDAAAGTVTNRRVFARAEGRGHPDGSCIDADGFLWNARWDGGGLIRWAPDASIDRFVALPCDRVTSCCFGGPDLATLYVTTVRYGLSEAKLAEQPLAGGVFALDAGVKGLPEGQFAG